MKNCTQSKMFENCSNLKLFLALETDMGIDQETQGQMRHRFYWLVMQVPESEEGIYLIQIWTTEK